MRPSLFPVVAAVIACGQHPSDAVATPPPRPPATTAPAQGTSGDRVVASWKGGQITYGDVQGSAKSELVKLEVDYLTSRYQAESQALEQMVVERILEEEAKERGLSGPEELVKKEVQDKVEDPTEAEIQAYYEVVQRQLRGAPLESVRERIAAEVRSRKESELFATWVQTLRDARGVSTDLPFPDMPRIDVSVDDDPFLGPADARVTIVQFAEYQCPYCGKAAATIDRVLDSYPGKVRMVFRDFPLGFHDRAIPAAVAANCAGQQGRYWEMHRALMADQQALDDPTLERHARAAELDLGRWQKCRRDPAMQMEVEKDMADGSAAGVTGTPAFFINGIMLSGALPFSEFKAVIDRELSR